MRFGLFSGMRPGHGRNSDVSTPFGISSTRGASRFARSASSGVVAITAAACLSPSRSTRPLSDPLGAGLGERRVPEAVGGHVRDAEPAPRDQGRDDPGDLEHAQGGAPPHLGRVRERDLHRASAARHRAGRSVHAHALAQRGVVGELGERLGQVAEVVEAVEGARVGTEVAVDQARLLPGLGQRPDAAAQGREQAHPHQRRFRATTRKPVLSSGRRRAASRFQRLRRS